MRAVKALVAFLGVLLVAGLALLGYGLYTKAPSKGTAGASAPTSTVTFSAATSAAEFGRIAVPVPAGSRVEQMVVVGDQLVLRLTGTGGERVLVLDPAHGRAAGEFILTPEPAVR